MPNQANIAVCRYCGTKYGPRKYGDSELKNGAPPPPPEQDMRVHKVFCKCYTCQESKDGTHPCQYQDPSPHCDHYMAHPGRVERMANIPGPDEDDDE